MARLSLKLLGGFEAQLDGEPVTGFDSNKARALLVYLAVESDRPHRRESLAALLWPDYRESSARTTLRKTLYNLRNAIGDRDADPPFLFITRDRLQFNTASGHWLDVAILEEVCTDTDRATKSELAAAADLITGDFLAGFTLPDALDFDDWTSTTREQLRQLGLKLLGVLVNRCTAENDDERALIYARRRVTMEPWLEAAQRQLIYLLAATGRRSEALRQYRRCVRVLEDELNAAPTSETTALYEAIRTAEGPVPRLAVVERESPVTHKANVPHPPSFLDETARPAVSESPVFLGREPELARLHGYLDAALEGRGQATFIVGGPGRGKTALMQAFAARAMAAHPDLLVIQGACNSYSGTGDAYLPFHEALGMLAGNVASRWHAGIIDRDHAQRLWSALPRTLAVMVDRGPYIVDTLVPGTDIIAHAVQAGLDTAAWMPELRTLAHRVNVGGLQQQALFQQVTNVLRAIAMEHPLMLILDDLQWVDRGSAGLLFHLGRRLQGCRLLILGAYRPEEVRSGAASTTHPLAKLVNEFRRTFGDVWIDLREADANEGRAFVRSLIDTERNRLQNDFRTSLHNHTGGHPLFTIEFLRALQARDALQRSTDGFWVQNGNLDWTAVPARIEAVIAERLSHLNQVERDLLEVASVEGERFTAQVIAQVQGLKERSVLHILNESLRDRHRLVREVDEVKTDDCYLTQFAFGHALFREHLYHRIGDGERRVLHHEVAVALERLYGGTDDRIVSQLAHHFDLAGRTRQAIYYAVRAGQRSRRTYANDEASQYFHRALDLLESIDQDDQLTERDQISRLDALQAMGNLCIDTGKIAEAERYLHQAVAIGRQLELDPQMLAVLYHQLGEALWWQGEYAESLRIGEEGLAMIGDDRTSLGAALMSQRIAAGCAVTGQWTRAWTLTHRTASFIKDLPYSSILKTAFTHIILKCTMSKDVNGVRYWLDHVKRQAQAHGDLLAMGTAHYDTARLMANIGDNQGAIKQTVKARTLWARIGDCKRESWACRELAFRHLIAGNLQAAARCAERELRLIQTVGTRRDIASGRSLTGRIARCRGEIAQAIEAFTDANTRYRAIHSLEGTARTFGLLGRVHLASGNRSEAQLCFKQAMLNVARIESDIALQWQLVTLLVPLTSGLEAALDDLAAFRAWIGHYLDQNPQFDGFLRQWSLQPVAYDLGGDNALEASETVLTDSDWTWEDAFEDCRYVRRGGLEIDAAPTRYLWGMNVSAPRWMRPLPSAGTGSAIQVNCEPARADRPGIGGLLLWKDRRHYLWLERGRFGPEDIAFGGCIANRDRVIGRGRLPGSPVALRLALSDGQVHAFCSSNEGQWFSVGHTAFPLDETVRAGVHALGIDGVIDQLTGMIDQIVYLDVYPEGTAIRFAGFKLWEGEPVGES